MWPYLYTFSLLMTIGDMFHLYNTDMSDNPDYKDCLYSFTLINDTNEWQLIPYCMHHNTSDSSEKDGRCDENATYTFAQLKSKGVDNHHLYRWHAPIDLINDYQKYLTNGDIAFASHLYCNCSVKWFGTRCQYSFTDESSESTVRRIVNNAFSHRKSLSSEYEMVNDTSRLTCYEGIRCHSVICLDWREVCNGIYSCENGEDEPAECLSLETNECQDDEYRCRFGSCIPKVFLRDLSYDCMDLSDEPVETLEANSYNDCYESSKLKCDYRLCDAHHFPCGDGQCITVENWNDQCGSGLAICQHCHNGRDLFLTRSLIDTNLFDNRKSSNNHTFECHLLLLCLSLDRKLNLFGYDRTICSCLDGTAPQVPCRKYFEHTCSRPFFFQTPNNILYPFVRLRYSNISNAGFEWWLPSHFCYNATRCPNLPFEDSTPMDDWLCVARSDFPSIRGPSEALIRLFSACTLTPTAVSTNDTRLFFCKKSMKWISRHKIYDESIDCLYGEDENGIPKRTMMLLANLTDRFKCATTNQWPTRRWIGSGSCSDKSDTWLIGQCKRASDVACQFLRGLYRQPINYLFRENCDGHPRIPSGIQNETDETSCEEWSAYRRCDTYWDLINGEDELNCSNTIASYITNVVAKCHVEEHYCIFRNGTMGCLFKEYAGDGHVDCLGGTDERGQCMSRDPLYLFQCDSGHCAKLSTVCHEDCGCANGEDELMCPWTEHIIDRYPDYMFFCKNGTAFRYARRCDRVIDCQPDAEDEWLCDLTYERTMHSLDFLDAYPPVSVHPSSSTTDRTAPTSDVSPMRNFDWFDGKENILEEWYCNRGVPVNGRASRVQCFCPPSYYGARCEYQSERLLVTLRVDTPATMSGHQDSRNAIRLLACLMLNDRVVHHEQMLHVQVTKQMFYLNYPRPPPKPRGNWTVRLDAFLVNTVSVQFVAAWKFAVPFSFLPVHRLVLSLTLENQQTCHTLPCVHGHCREYLNAPHGDYCQCEQHWSGQYCQIPINCSCAAHVKKKG